MKTEVIHTKRKGKSILIIFSLIVNYSVRSIYSHTNSHNNAVTQYHFDGAQRVWATCGFYRLLAFVVNKQFFAMSEQKRKKIPCPFSSSKKPKR